jgi:hypothetical protein
MASIRVFKSAPQWTGRADFDDWFHERLNFFDDPGFEPRRVCGHADYACRAFMHRKLTHADGGILLPHVYRVSFVLEAIIID